jgi:pyruvate,orthophosphate dikinase
MLTLNPNPNPNPPGDPIEHEKGGKEEKLDAKSIKKQKEEAAKFPLLLSVRSGAAVSMPGMMDTVLNLGMNDEVVLRISTITNNTRFAYDTYRRFLQMYGSVVMGVDKDRYQEILTDARSRAGKKKVRVSVRIMIRVQVRVR